MFELILCSLLTIFPDYMYRRHVQGKRWGHEIDVFTVWYELRWGITLCVLLTLTLVTTIFYYHPSTSNASSFFRTVTILPEAGGRVAEIYVSNHDHVEEGQPLFKLDDSSQQSAVESAKRKVKELDAALVVAESELHAANGMVDQARGSLKQATDDLARNRQLSENVVSQRELDRLENLVDSREGTLASAIANQDAVEARIQTLLPAQKSSAEAALHEAEVSLEKTIVYAGTAGAVQQFQLRAGDYVSPVLRPAGILIPDDTGYGVFQAGFGQISAQVIKPGMVGEITCFSTPFTIIPVVVTKIQDVIAAGQFRPTDQLRDIQDQPQPGTVTVVMEPLYKGDADQVPPGSKCVANAYSSFHDRLDDEGLPFSSWLFFHGVDTVGIVHAAGLRIRALLLPVQTLVLTGH